MSNNLEQRRQEHRSDMTKNNQPLKEIHLIHTEFILITPQREGRLGDVGEIWTFATIRPISDSLFQG
jgi:hypothetical protein